mmetsp:Transcript_84362/g.149156  ORF Transcript_84362/g.149156 Transcript_84362/m.149156 type:complete len:189 (+) Transcript_84362:111-677(+)|eukprot:CAMPEP_0197655470 /NCGR_PEP_ID=MMETSP1338-20131121/39473_1 /TAXON_ID=43686 ORGANISM="Pelagodinium beii, Strain RCC1491" /NCGR_SAMPLE_ID=MMETSP1338 /ASSEMBLY_ACC=CAM_ASM_000754 /LENGTH=188 /DNA_ID=CAMNT_0043231123 /DNA_START=107 /DNA_END=673 /DNA_ORIENTATION=-
MPESSRLQSPCSRKCWRSASVLVALLAWLAPNHTYGNSMLLFAHAGGARGGHRGRLSACAVGSNDVSDPKGKGKEPDQEKLKDVVWWKMEEEQRLFGPNMPFRVVRVSPPPAELLGYQLLDYKTSKGDVIRMKKTESSFVVSKVRFLYDLVGGSYRVRSKVLEVQTPQRYKLNAALEGLVPQEEPKTN